jgi:hypothetical protein
MSPDSKARSNWIVVSGFFSREEDVLQAMIDVLASGIPRDLIEIAVSKEAAALFSKRVRTRRPSYRAANAGRGALIGLITFALISAALIVSGAEWKGQLLTWIMLLGPNVGVVLGAVWGFLFVPPKARGVPTWLQRVREEKGILFVVRTKSEREAQDVAHDLASRGATSVKLT